MKRQTMTAAAIIGLLVALSAGDLLAAGKGNGGKKGGGSGNCPTPTATRPEGSQRRDGTFLTTGTTANGSTTRPGNGKGAQDGSGSGITK